MVGGEGGGGEGVGLAAIGGAPAPRKLHDLLSVCLLCFSYGVNTCLFVSLFVIMDYPV